jgi:glycosyltransferase involved in cell wall biosynthesis
VAFECAIVGDGEERRDLERLIRSHGLHDRIRITGFLAQEELIPLYQQAGVVTLPALSESHFGIPNILLEALAVETPVICTALPSLSEFMEDGVHGIFVPEQSPSALADALEALARDPERGRAIGAAGRRQIEALFDARKNVLEALAVETPVICTPLPSLSEVMEDGTHGLYVPEQSPQELAAALESLARNPGGAGTMGAAGRRKIEELFDAEKNTATLDALFRPSTKFNSSREPAS